MTDRPFHSPSGPPGLPIVVGVGLELNMHCLGTTDYVPWIEIPLHLVRQMAHTVFNYPKVVSTALSMEIPELHFDDVALCNLDGLCRVDMLRVKVWEIWRSQNPTLRRNKLLSNHFCTILGEKRIYPNHHIKLTPFKSPPIIVKELRSDECDEDSVAVAHSLFLLVTGPDAQSTVDIVVRQSRAILVRDCDIITLWVSIGAYPNFEVCEQHLDLLTLRNPNCLG